MDGDAMCCALSGGDDGEYSEWSDVSIVKARKSRKTGKEHVCCECGEPIPVGAQHELYKLKSRGSGTIDDYRTCMSCVEIRDHFSCSEGWTFCEVWSQLEENFFPDMKAGGPCMTGLSPAAKHRRSDAGAST